MEQREIRIQSAYVPREGWSKQLEWSKTACPPLCSTTNLTSVWRMRKKERRWKEGKERERERERELSPLPAPIPEDVIVNSSHEIVGQYVPPVHPVHGRPSTKIHTYLHDTRQCESIAEWEALQAAPAWEHRAHLYARKVPSAAKTHRAISRYLRRDTLPNKSRSWRLIQISFR